ncbi:hypothetical protein EPN42_13040 [bacterium]|nr:MAG: hypothetical protein EPN42_13040 [bacterium]
MKRLTLFLALTLFVNPIWAGASTAGTIARTASFSVTNLPLPNVLAGLSREFGVNIVGDASLAQINVTLSLSNVTLDAAMAAIERAYKLEERRVDGTIIVSSPGSMGTTAGTPATIHLHVATASVIARELSTSFGGNLIAIGDDRTNSVVLLGSPDTVDSASALIAALDVAGQDGAGSVSYALNHISPEDASSKLIQAIPTSIGQITVVPDVHSNTVVITGAPGALAFAESVMKRLDAVPKKVLVQVRVLDLMPTNDQRDVGIILGGVAPGGGQGSGAITVTPNQLFTPFANRSLAVNATINTLIEHGEGQILAEPNQIVNSGETAHIHIGDTVPIVTNNGGLVGGVTVTSTDTGIVLDARPIIGADGSVNAIVHLQYSYVNGSSQGYPIFANRDETSHFSVHEGQTITFGGLTEDDHTKTTTKVPLLGDIPLFGRLFQNVSSTAKREEVVFQVTFRAVE